MSERLTDLELQSLRNLGGDSERAADEIGALRALLLEARDDVKNRAAFCTMVATASGVGEYTREHSAALAEYKNGLLMMIDAALGKVRP